MPSRTSAQKPVLWIATRNRGKTREFSQLLRGFGSIRDLHDLPDFPEIRETGKTFAANARLKACALSRALPNHPILADDSGLVVPALGGRPGVYKANLAEVEESMKRRGVERCLAGMRILARGRCGIVITLGPRGLVMEEGRTKMAVPAPKIRLWDATGSGDVVTAALIHGIRCGWEIEKIAGFAVWAGSENAARRDGMVKRLKERGVLA
jgi:non-canonical purine NTP pyrophosphatase (RdgB/HAM1 family)